MPQMHDKTAINATNARMMSVMGYCYFHCDFHRLSPYVKRAIKGTVHVIVYVIGALCSSFLESDKKHKIKNVVIVIDTYVYLLYFSIIYCNGHCLLVRIVIVMRIFIRYMISFIFRIVFSCTDTIIVLLSTCELFIQSYIE